MTDCRLCSFKGEKLYEDEILVAGLPENPFVPGHMVVFPKRHIQIIEQAPDDIVSALFDTSNKISVALIEGLKAQGSNFILMNGLAAGQSVPHISVDLIPRMKDDGINFAWPSRKLSEEQMAIVEGQVRSEMQMLMLPVQAELVKEEPEMPVERPKKALRKSDPFIKQLKRMP